MKTPKQKAKELVDRIFSMTPVRYIKDSKNSLKPDRNIAKQCALIAVDEILTVLYDLDITSAVENYWEEVRQEIENL